MAWFDIADSITILHHIVRDPNNSQRLIRATTLALRRLARLSKDRQAASRALGIAAEQLPDRQQAKATMTRAADFLSKG
ncbi:MAG: hypothetical protein GX353_00270 [Oligella ureolytica]|nr:hypothetical protein [Oligella ureolytica]